MPHISHRFGFVVVPADVDLSKDCASKISDKITIKPLKLSNEKLAKQVLPLFVLCEAGVPKMLVEVARFSQPFGSWLIVPEDVKLVPEVCSNGNITIVTRVDPLFPALAIMDCLRKVTGNDFFQPLEAMCITADGTDLARFCDSHQFSLICDIKEAAGDKYYRLSDEKVAKWLVQKHANLVKHPHINNKSATQIISQYLTDTWEQVMLKSVASSATVDPSANTVRQKGEDLAMAIMMEDAKESNRAKRSLQHTNGSKLFSAKKSKTKTSKKAPRQSATASNFWSSMKSTEAP